MTYEIRALQLLDQWHRVGITQLTGLVKSVVYKMIVETVKIGMILKLVVFW